MSNYYETGENHVPNPKAVYRRIKPIEEVNIPGNGSWANICSVHIYDRLQDNIDKWVDPDTKQVYDIKNYLNGKTPEGIHVYGPNGKYLGYCPDFAERRRLKEEGYVVNQMLTDNYDPSKNLRGPYERKK